LKYILDIKISLAKMKNNKAPGDGEVTGDIITVKGPVGMQGIYSYEEYLAVKGDARQLKEWSATINI
jgi:hypothetical protein